MRCAECREQVSARLDDEDDPGLRTAVDEHLASCASCREWRERAAQVTRLARMTVATQTPDVTATVLAAAPRGRRGMVRQVMRLVLALLAVGQIGLGLASIDGVLQSRVGAPGGGVQPAHFSHEFAAFTIAVGIGFAWVAWRTSRAAGLVPTLATFVLVLAALEVIDLARGYADHARLLSHSLVLAGLLVVLALCTRRLGGDGIFPHVGRGRAAQRAVAETDTDDLGRPDQSGHDGLRPSARHDAA
jgi:predicted anti-sigma-YlaC factor YlaD